MREHLLGTLAAGSMLAEGTKSAAKSVAKKATSKPAATKRPAKKPRSA